MSEVKEEIEGEVKEHFSEHQLKIETIQIMEDELNDLSGANKPVEIKLFGPSYLKLRDLARRSRRHAGGEGQGQGPAARYETTSARGNPT